MPINALIDAVNSVIEANRDFRAGMPAEWEGDPLQDAIEALDKAAAEYRTSGMQK